MMKSDCSPLHVDDQREKLPVIFANGQKGSKVQAEVLPGVTSLRG